jgi:hypothetical protein
MRCAVSDRGLPFQGSFSGRAYRFGIYDLVEHQRQTEIRTAKLESGAAQ